MGYSTSPAPTRAACPAVKTVVSYVFNELDRDAVRRERRHLLRCADCAKEIELLRPEAPLKKGTEHPEVLKKCPGDSELREYAHGEFRPEYLRAIRLHLSGCKDCCAEVLAVQRRGCPSDEMLLDYVTRELKEEDYHRIGLHLLRCDECRETVVDLVKQSQQSTAQ